MTTQVAWFSICPWWTKFGSDTRHIQFWFSYFLCL